MPVLEPIAPDLWAATTSKRFPAGVMLPIRMTVVRLPDGAVVLVSPIAMDEGLAAEVSALGPVRYLVGPSRLHHLWLGDARERFPQATLLGAPGLADRRPDLSFTGDLLAPPWGDALGTYLVAGAPRTSEVVLHHGPSRTVIATDLVFNITRPANRRTAFVLSLAGTRGRFGVSREWRLLIKDRPAFEASLDRVLALPIDRVVMAHGDVLESDARGAMARVFGRA